MVFLTFKTTYNLQDYDKIDETWFDNHLISDFLFLKCWNWTQGLILVGTGPLSCNLRYQWLL